MYVVLCLYSEWQSFNVYGGCSADCLDLMVGNETLYVTHIIPHMHYKGRLYHPRGNSCQIVVHMIGNKNQKQPLSTDYLVFKKAP